MLGALSPIARIAVLATVIVSLAAIGMDFGLHVEGMDWLEGALLTIVYIVLAISFFELR